MSGMTPFYFAAVVRVSGRVQRESYDDQKKRILDYCEKRGWFLPDDRIYGDFAVSGANYNARTELKRMERDAQRGLFNVLLVSNQDRLIREFYDFGDVMKKIERDCRVQLFDIAAPHELQDPALFRKPGVGLMVTRAVKAIMASEERDAILQRSLDGKRRETRDGRLMSAHAPYGYRTVFDTRSGKSSFEPNEIDEERHPVPGTPFHSLSLIPRLLLNEGKSCHQIAVEFNRRNIPAPRSVKMGWTAPAVIYIVQNPFYYGETQYERIVKHDKRKVQNKDPIRGLHNLPTPWTRDIGLEMQRKLEQNAKRSPRAFVSKNPLVDILKCGFEEPYHPMMLRKRPKTGNNDYFCCSHHTWPSHPCKPNYVYATALLYVVKTTLDKIGDQGSDEEFFTALLGDESSERLYQLQHEDDELERLLKTELPAKRRSAAVRLERGIYDEEDFKLLKQEYIEEERRAQSRRAIISAELLALTQHEQNVAAMRNAYVMWGILRKYFDQTPYEWPDNIVHDVRACMETFFEAIIVASEGPPREERFDINFVWRVLHG